MSRQLHEYHARLGYRFIPGLRARVPHESGGYLVRVNQSGFRCNHEFVPGRGEGARRVLLFGDSFTAGDGVSNEKRYGDRLEALVPRLEVFNFGLSGTGTDQQYLIYEEYGRELERDLVVIAVLVENIRRVAAPYRQIVEQDGRTHYLAKPYFVLQGEELVLHHVPPPREPLQEQELPAELRDSVDRGGRLPQLRSLVNRLGMRDLAQRLTRYQPVPEYDDPDHPAWVLMKAILVRWISRLEGPVLLVPLPLYQHVEETCDSTGYQARFAELAAATGCALHDPLPDLQRHPAEQRRRFRFATDVHPTSEGHAALAASLAPVVRRLLGDGLS